MFLRRIGVKYHNLSIQVKASLWFVVCSVLQKGISVLTTPIFTRLLTTSEYGNYNVFNSWLGILTPIISLNLCAGVFSQGLVKFDNDRHKFSSSLQGLTLVLITLWTIVYLANKNFWNNLFSLSTIQVLFMLGLIWTSSVFGFWSSNQRVTYKYKALIIVTLITSVLKPLFGVVLVIHSSDKVLARIFGIFIVEMMCYLWLAIYQFYKGKCFFSWKYWSYSILFNLPLIPHYLSQTILNDADRIMIKEMVGESFAGIYSLAYSLAIIMLLFNAAFMNVLSPWIYTKIKEKKLEPIGKISYICLFIIATVNLLLIIIAPELVMLFAPSEYYEAIWIIPPVAMSSFFIFLYDLFAKFEFYFEKTKFIMIASVLGALLNIILNYFFINAFGYIAAGYTTLICMIMYSAGHYLFMRIICKKYLDDYRVYNLRLIIFISTLFCALGFLFMFFYSFLLIRVLLVILFMTVFAVFGKKIKIKLAKYFGEIGNKRKESFD